VKILNPIGKTWVEGRGECKGGVRNRGRRNVKNYHNGGHGGGLNVNLEAGLRKKEEWGGERISKDDINSIGERKGGGRGGGCYWNIQGRLKGTKRTP